MLAISFAVAIAAVLLIARNKAMVEDLIRRLGAFGPMLSLMLYALLGLSPIPADPLTLVNGAVFGPICGGLVTWVGTTLAAVVEYFMGTRIANAADFEHRRSELLCGLNDLPIESVWFLIGGRMLTGAGSKIVSYTSGIYRVPFLRYLWTSALTMLIGAVLFALGGFGLLSIF